MLNLTWKTVTDEKCCQGGYRRVVLNETIREKIDEGLTFTIPTGSVTPGTRVKLFVGIEHTCPMELKVALNGNACHDADFGMDSYAFLNDPSLKPHAIATYTTTAEGNDPVVTISGNPNGFITYLELKIG